MAILVMEDGQDLDEDAFSIFCRENLAKFKVPKHFATIDELPRNASGKVLKRVLRDQFISQEKS